METRQSRRIKARGIVSLAATLALVLSACGGAEESASEPEPSTDAAEEEVAQEEVDEPDDGAESGEADDEAASDEVEAYMDDLYQAALADGEDEIVVYGIKTETQCYDQFSSIYEGITVEGQYMVGETFARMQQEHVSGQNVGSLLRTGDTSILALLDEGVLTTYEPPAASAMPEEAFGMDYGMYNDSQRLSGFAYNTANISEDEAPTGWADLADPQWQGRIVMPDPTSPGAGLSILQALLDSAGVVDEAWLEDFAANDPALIQGVQPTIEALSSGEYDIMIGGLDQVTGPRLEDGSDIAYVFPVEGATPVSRHWMSIVTNAPAPNATRLLVNWMLSDEGQTCLTQNEQEYSPRDDIDPPPGLPTFDELDGVAQQVPPTMESLARQSELLELFGNVFRN